MRGFLSPAVQTLANDSQKTFQTLARGRRTKLARLAKTTLVKADQWARGGEIAADAATALEQSVKAYEAKAAKKKA